MLSYRHAFHAGNHADLLKHLTLVLCCEHLRKKDKAFFYLDTHAGAGIYPLNSEHAQKNTEYKTGIELIAKQMKAPPVFDRYLALTNQAKTEHKNTYPGSPWLAAQLLRPQDQACLHELHPEDNKTLNKLFASNKQINVLQSDGFKSLKATLPPISRRGLILIDPPYEQEQEYQHVITAIKEGFARFSTGIYALWYPLINRSNHSKQKAASIMLHQFKNQFQTEQLHVQFILNKETQGMYGSGMAILNPPWGLAEQLTNALEFVCSLDETKQSNFNIEQTSANQLTNSSHSTQ